MGLRIFSVLGEALNFGGRRMETIARVAWLPVLIIMIVNMVTVFAYLSVIAGRIITFEDVPTYVSAQQSLFRLASVGFQTSPAQMWLITVVSLILNWILVSSYMAPHIRYVGLGEKPAPGAVRLHFGADQFRFVLSSLANVVFLAVLVFVPIISATFYVMKYITDALSQTLASFPNPDSLHTIEIITGAELAAANGAAWMYDSAIPIIGMAPLALLLWLLTFLHFSPRNRPSAPEGGNVILRAITTLLVTVGLLAAGYYFLKEMVMGSFAANAMFLGTVAEVVEQLKAINPKLAIDMTSVKESIKFVFKSPIGRLLFFGVASFYLVNYFSLRLFAYPGVTVCRKSLGLGNTLRVSRGWNIIRIAIIVYASGALLFYIYKWVIDYGLLQMVLLKGVLTYLLTAVGVTSKLFNSGVTQDWVLPLFIWIWNIVKIIVNLVWTFFCIGVAAALYGRLYRESVRTD